MERCTRPVALRDCLRIEQRHSTQVLAPPQLEVGSSSRRRSEHNIQRRQPHRCRRNGHAPDGLADLRCDVVVRQPTATDCALRWPCCPSPNWLITLQVAVASGLCSQVPQPPWWSSRPARWRSLCRCRCRRRRLHQQHRWLSRSIFAAAPRPSSRGGLALLRAAKSLQVGRHEINK